jgi:colicin import membrane protein
MSQRQKIVTVVRKGECSAPYVGFDAVKASQVFDAEAANVENDDVRLYAFPQHSKSRRPSSDARYLVSVKEAEAMAAKEREEAEEAKRQAEQLGTDEAKAAAAKEEAEAKAAEEAAKKAKSAKKAK